MYSGYHDLIDTELLFINKNIGAVAERLAGRVHCVSHDVLSMSVNATSEQSPDLHR